MGSEDQTSIPGQETQAPDTTEIPAASPAESASPAAEEGADQEQEGPNPYAFIRDIEKRGSGGKILVEGLRRMHESLLKGKDAQITGVVIGALVSHPDSTHTGTTVYGDFGRVSTIIAEIEFRTVEQRRKQEESEQMIGVLRALGKHGAGNPGFVLPAPGATGEAPVEG